jgi:flagellar basal body-associated protein FliL
MALDFPIILIIILGILVAGLIIFLSKKKVMDEEFKKTGKHPKGHYIGLGMAIGMALGMPIGMALGIPSLGISFGLPLGLAIGIAWEKKNEDKLRPLTEKEEKVRRKIILYLVGALILGVLVFAAMLLFF